MISHYSKLLTMLLILVYQMLKNTIYQLLVSIKKTRLKYLRLIVMEMNLKCLRQCEFTLKEMDVLIITWVQLRVWTKNVMNTWLKRRNKLLLKLQHKYKKYNLSIKKSGTILLLLLRVVLISLLNTLTHWKIQRKCLWDNSWWNVWFQYWLKVWLTCGVLVPLIQ